MFKLCSGNRYAVYRITETAAAIRLEITQGFVHRSVCRNRRPIVHAFYEADEYGIEPEKQLRRACIRHMQKLTKQGYTRQECETPLFYDFYQRDDARLIIAYETALAAKEKKSKVNWKPLDAPASKSYTTHDILGSDKPPFWTLYASKTKDLYRLDLGCKSLLISSADLLAIGRRFQTPPSFDRNTMQEITPFVRARFTQLGTIYLCFRRSLDQTEWRWSHGFSPALAKRLSAFILELSIIHQDTIF